MISIAVDGPAASGKSTVAKIIAKRLGFIYIDTGAMYRAITLAVLKRGINLEDSSAVEYILETSEITFQPGPDGQKVFLNNEEVTEAIRSTEVTQYVSEVSAVEAVRTFLVKKQRAMAEKSSVIMDGRDIGTVVLPDADYKFYLVASSKVRAQRRYEENQRKGLSDLSLEEIEADIISRDHYDMNRKISPLAKAEDAIEIDTSDLSIDEMVERLIFHIKEAN